MDKIILQLYLITPPLLFIYTGKLMDIVIGLYLLTNRQCGWNKGKILTTYLKIS